MVNLCPSVSPEFPYCALEETPCQSADHPAEEKDEKEEKKTENKEQGWKTDRMQTEGKNKIIT